MYYIFNHFMAKNVPEYVLRGKSDLKEDLFWEVQEDGTSSCRSAFTFTNHNPAFGKTSHLLSLSEIKINHGLFDDKHKQKPSSGTLTLTKAQSS